MGSSEMVSQNKSFLLCVALVRISLSFMSRINNTYSLMLKYNTGYSVSGPLTVPEKRKQWIENIKLNKDTLLVRGGTRKGCPREGGYGRMMGIKSLQD